MRLTLGANITVLLLVALASTAAIGTALWWVLGRPPIRARGPWTPTESFDFAKIVLSIIGGIGGVVALVVAYRKQRLGEAAERREDAKLFAENITKTTEQLGSDDAPVRLSGMYALEGLPQTPVQRQTVINILCAYLRVPYTPPDSQTHNNARSASSTSQGKTASSQKGEGSGPEADLRKNGRDPEQERKVRLTAQQILAEHLRSTATGASADAFWEDVRLDLTGATLLDLHLTGCQISSADFADAQFYGATRFDGVEFHGDIRFNGAVFLGEASFDRAFFHQAADFSRVTFHEEAKFNITKFKGETEFVETLFVKDARFEETRFFQTAIFDNATFKAASRFLRTRFYGDAWFNRTMFCQYGLFDGAIFNHAAVFNESWFQDYCSFDLVRFQYGAIAREGLFPTLSSLHSEDVAIGAPYNATTFPWSTRFDEVRFDGKVSFDGSEFHGNAWFEDVLFGGELIIEVATFHRLTIFRHAIFQNDTNFNDVTFRSYINFSLAEFHKAALFNGATDEERTKYIPANFDGVLFHHDVQFNQMSFNDLSSFDQVKIRMDVPSVIRKRRKLPRGYTVSEISASTGPNLTKTEGTWRYLEKVSCSKSDSMSKRD